MKNNIQSNEDRRDVLLSRLAEINDRNWERRTREQEQAKRNAENFEREAARIKALPWYKRIFQ